MNKIRQNFRRFLQDFYLVLIMLFLYAPIATMVVLSFNSSKSRTQWGGFTLQWYTQMFASRNIMAALQNTLLIAFLSALIATIIGTMAAMGINGMNRKMKTICMSVTNIPMLNADIVTGISLMLLFIALGILFDIIGVAVTAANPKPFNSMAAHRVKGAKEALYLIRNAEKVASFCNDVVGDICGIVSGSTATVIVVLLQNSFGWRSIVVSTVVTALISGLTIGGKAIGKKVAMKKSKDVIYLTAKVLSVLHLVR